MNCQTTPKLIISEVLSNNDEWHSIRWTKSNEHLELFVDGILAGISDIKECVVNTNTPFYLGGTNPEDYEQVQQSIVRKK